MVIFDNCFQLSSISKIYIEAKLIIDLLYLDIADFLIEKSYVLFDCIFQEE